MHTLPDLLFTDFAENIFRSDIYWQGYVGDKHINSHRYLCCVLYFILFIALRPRVGRSGVRIPARKRDFSLLQNAQTGCRAHPASCPMRNGVLSLGIKRQGREFNHSPPSGAEVKEWRCTASSHAWLRTVESENLSCFNPLNTKRRPLYLTFWRRNFTFKF